MRIIKVAKKKNKLDKVKKLMDEVCEDLKKEGISSDAFSIRLDIMELINKVN